MDNYIYVATNPSMPGLVKVGQSWLGLFEQFSGFYKWSLCRV
jgi:hypothetical protein